MFDYLYYLSIVYPNDIPLRYLPIIYARCPINPVPGGPVLSRQLSANQPRLTGKSSPHHPYFWVSQNGATPKSSKITLWLFNIAMKNHHF